MEELNGYEQNELLLDVRDAENLAVRLREMSVRLVKPYRTHYTNGEPSDIQVTIESVGDDSLVITLPVMLPRRTATDKARLLIQPMYEACRRYQQEYEEKNDGKQFRLRECVLVYEHIYSHSHRRFIDHDNLELKHCQDILDSFFLVRDSSTMCSAFQCSHREEKEGTRIWVLSPEDFIAWLKQHGKYWEYNEKVYVESESLPSNDCTEWDI